MYNRYIPQGDGTYRRNRMADNIPEPPQPVHHREEQKPEPPLPPPEQKPCQNCIHGNPQRRPSPPPPKRNSAPVSMGSFLKQLLPKNFDTEDLLIVLLLLLMAGDCQEDQNSALLTLILYLFL